MNTTMKAATKTAVKKGAKNVAKKAVKATARPKKYNKKVILLVSTAPVVDVEIESNWSPSRVKIGYKFPFDKMKVADSFFIGMNQPYYKELSFAVTVWNKEHPNEFFSIYRIVDANKKTIGKRIFRRS